MVTVNEEQVARFADFLRSYDGVQPFDFCSLHEGVLFPPRNEPGVVDYFFFCCAQQFGFWHLKGGRYDQPMIARVDGVEAKGSDFLWRCATRAWNHDKDFFTPSHMAKVPDAEWSRVFSDDTGANPLPMWTETLQIIHESTEWYVRQGASPSGILMHALQSTRSLTAFLQLAGRIPGYAEDPLRKKLILLAITLENRPEQFLVVTDPESYDPIIDYHLQRSALRTGLVRVDEPTLKAKLERRELVNDAEENTVRKATFDAIRELVRRSGRSVAAIDYFFFTNRTRCPEMTEPQCPACPVNAICRHETRLFQPVFRTTAY